MRYRVTVAERSFEIDARVGVSGAWRVAGAPCRGDADADVGARAPGGGPVSVDVVEVGPGGWVSWRAGGRVERFRVELAGGAREALVTPERAPGGAPYAVRVEDARRAALPALVRAPTAPRPVTVSAPMPGRVVKLLVEPGQVVQAGQAVAVVEAMKMENELLAPRAGRVERLLARAGDGVEAGGGLVVIA